MQQGITKFAIGVAAAFLASFPLTVEAQGLPQSSDAIYFTLSGHTPIDGPIYEPAAGSSAVAPYANAVTKETLIQADRMSAFWLEEENPEAYISFLIGSLVVPMHESSLQHYRRLAHESGRCAETLNSGSLAATAGAKAERIFDSVVKSGPSPIMPSCRAFRAGDPALQLLGSYDGLSTGLMQINFVAHPDYLPHGDFLSVKKTLARGLEQYFGGFKKIVENPAKYPCVRGVSVGDIDFTGVVRGAWSGAYNGGSVLETCRFTALSRSDSTAREQKWARENDIPFKRDFDGVLNLRSGLYAIALSGEEAQLHRDLVDTFESVKRGADLTVLMTQARSIRAAIARVSGAQAGPVRPAAVTNAKVGAPAAKLIAQGTLSLADGGRFNVRLRSSTEARVMDTLKSGTHVDIYGRFRAKDDPVGWVAITPAKDRWVYAKYVSIAPTRR